MNTLAMIPQPHYCKQREETVDFSAFKKNAVLMVSGDEKRLAFHAQKIVETFTIEKGSFFSLSFGSFNCSEPLNPEHRTDWYRINIEPCGFQIVSDTERGLFYGMITLGRVFAQFGSNVPCMEIVDYADMALRCEYWDLRSVHSPVWGLLKAIPRIARAKLNGLVIEYEATLSGGDLFETNPLIQCWTSEEHQKIKDTCKLWFIDIIPLQQSFGHLEYVLKDERYSHLKETPLATGDLCPQKPGSIELARKLIERMAKLHPESQYLHLGCDEVWSLCTCDACKATHKTKELIAIEFINKLIDAACNVGKTPLFWQDMLMHATDEELAQLDKRAIVCIWLYSGNDLEYVVGHFIERLNGFGIKYIGCPAMRASDRSDRQNYPVLSERINNIRRWHRLVKKYDIQCMINTNWAASFALAKPYGVYETSVYPLYYSADQCWNRDVEEDKFLLRFFADYHGMYTPDPLLLHGFTNEDYFHVVAQITDKLPREKDIPELVADWKFFENRTHIYFPLTAILYRLEFYNSSEERSSLLEKYLATKADLKYIVPRIEKKLFQYLDEDGVKQFIRSRMLTEEMMLQKAEELLNIPPEERWENDGLPT